MGLGLFKNDTTNHTKPDTPPDLGAATSGELELPTHEAQAGLELATSHNIYRPEIPRGTMFHKKKVLTVLALAVITLMFSIMYALTPRKPQSIEKTVTTTGQLGQSNGNLTAVNPPEEISQQPDTYQENVALGPPLSPFGNKVQSQGIEMPVPPQQPGYGYSQAGGLETTAEQTIKEARHSAIRFGGSPSFTESSQTQSASLLAGFSNLNQPAVNEQTGNLQSDDQNGQTQKNAFLDKNHSSKFYASSGLSAAVSPYEVKAGSIIPGVLITGINSDLPGRLTGQVRENVYDSVSGKYLLIPQGTRIIGVYDSKVGYAQNRVLVVWSRLIFPNGNSLDLEGMTGVDGGGYAGFKDKVNYHTGRLVTGVLLSSILSAGTKVATGSDDDNSSYGAMAAEGAAESVAAVGAKYTDKNLNVQPTLEIRPGFRFNIFVAKDFVLKPYEG
jgi:type IV secretory pathway VirB10-like protein